MPEKTARKISQQLAKSRFVGVSRGIVVAENECPFYALFRNKIVPHRKGVSIVRGKRQVARHDKEVGLGGVYRAADKIQRLSVQRATA